MLPRPLARMFFACLTLSFITFILLIQVYRQSLANNAFNLINSSLKPITGYFNYNQFKSHLSYVTFLCNDQSLPAARVTVHSLKKLNPTYPILVLTLPQVSNHAITQLKFLGANIRHVNPIESLSHYNKDHDESSCLHSKFLIFNLTEFSKIIYLETDSIILDNIDHTFDYSSISSISDLNHENHQSFHNHIIPITPSTDLFIDMINKFTNLLNFNKSNLDFIDWIFTSIDNQSDQFHYHDGMNDYPIISQHSSIFHFSSKFKPWNYHIKNYQNWTLHYYPSFFSKWWNTHYDIQHIFSEGIYNQSSKNEYKNWNNSQRLDFCNNYSAKFEDNHEYPIQDKFSVSISTYDMEKLPYLKRLIMHYLTFEYVDKIFIILHNPNISINKDLVDLTNRNHQVVLLQMESNSLNNYFLPLQELQTQAVFICDDDVLISHQDLKFAFDLWKLNSNSIHGYFSNLYSINTKLLESMNQNNQIDQIDSLNYLNLLDSSNSLPEYEIISTKSMFINANFLHAFTCSLQHEIHAYIDKNLNCQDIAMNMFVSGLTSLPSIKIKNQNPIYYFNSKNTKSHSIIRTKCIRDFIQNFWNNTNPLIENNDEYVSKTENNDEYISKTENNDEYVSKTENNDEYISKSIQKSQWKNFKPLLDELEGKKKKKIFQGKSQSSENMIFKEKSPEQIIIEEKSRQKMMSEEKKKRKKLSKEKSREKSISEGNSKEEAIFKKKSIPYSKEETISEEKSREKTISDGKSRKKRLSKENP